MSISNVSSAASASLARPPNAAPTGAAAASAGTTAVEAAKKQGTSHQVHHEGTKNAPTQTVLKGHLGVTKTKSVLDTVA